MGVLPTLYFLSGQGLRFGDRVAALNRAPREPTVDESGRGLEIFLPQDEAAGPKSMPTIA
jgi:hypothetical protein